MEPQWVINALFGTVMGGLGWFLNTLYHGHEAIRRELSEHRIDIAKTYITKDALQRLEEKIDRIYDKLDDKADR